MDVSKKTRNTEANTNLSSETEWQGQGLQLIQEVAGLTGLPLEWVRSELTKIIVNSGHKPNELTLEQLRASMLTFIEQVKSDVEREFKETVH